MAEMVQGGTQGAIRRAIVIGNGFAGAENQSIGLVRALGLSDRHSIYRVTRPRGGINKWLPWLPLSLHKKVDYVISGMPFSAEKIGLSSGVVEADAKQIANMARKTFDKDGPLLVVASGRDTIPVASAIKRLAPENVFLVQIQHPRSHLHRFDLVIAPRHDYYPLTPHAQKQIPWFLRRWITPREPPGKNVVLTIGALHQADPAALKSAASAWHAELAPLPKPLLVVNIGGPSGNCSYGVDLAKQLAAMLQNVLWSCGSVRISFSRRTPEKVSRLLIREFSNNPKVYIWDGEGCNPHMGHLALADAFMITADSVSMLSEACSTGKPVYVIGAEHCSWKLTDFQNRLEERGVVQPFTGKEDMSKCWSYVPLNDTAEAASQVIKVLAERGWSILI
ncbi:mitochondrial fission protein ELM1-like isoform X1 [Rosa rugosa]|uniref:mitochondrial fission protein ELM1-like isoform X1 n=1 Tax=Rosa rugosa TaxID=74645 RepID=UPI002B40F691|nr:mitochondrial fission protein ELM1-like isoform X1 [Rosa rugosa]